MLSLKKVVLLHNIYFKPERVCTSSVVETGLEDADVEDVVVEKRQEGDTVLESLQSDKTLKVGTEKSFPGTRNDQYAR